MSFGGSVDAMQKSYRANMKMLRKTSFNKNDSFADLKKAYELSASKKGIPIEKLSERDREQIKTRIVELQRAERAKFIRITVLFMLVLIGLVALGVYALEEYVLNPKPETQLVHETVKAEYAEKIYFYRRDAMKWQAEHHWNNAIFQYKKVLEAVPNDNEAIHGIIQVSQLRSDTTYNEFDVAVQDMEELLLTYHYRPDVVNGYSKLIGKRTSSDE